MKDNNVIFPDFNNIFFFTNTIHEFLERSSNDENDIIMIIIKVCKVQYL